MTEALALLLGGLLPPFIDFLTKTITNSKIRFWISVLVCGVIGILMNFNNPQIQEAIKNMALVFTSAQIVYKQFWKESPLRSDENKGQD